MTALEDLYYDNISPHERYIKRVIREDKLVKLICKNEEMQEEIYVSKQWPEILRTFISNIVIPEEPIEKAS